MVFSAFGSHCSAEVSLLVGRGHNVTVNLVFADDGGWQVVADVAVKRFKFQGVVVYAPNYTGERLSFFRRFEVVSSNGQLDAIIEPKIDKARQGASGSDRSESSLIDLPAEHNLVNRFRLDYLRREMWTLIHSLPSVQNRFYLDTVLVRRADSEFNT